MMLEHAVDSGGSTFSLSIMELTLSCRSAAHLRLALNTMKLSSLKNFEKGPISFIHFGINHLAPKCCPFWVKFSA